MASPSDLQQLDVLLRELKVKEACEVDALAGFGAAKADLAKAQAGLQAASEALDVAKSEKAEAMKAFQDFAKSL